MACGGGRSVFRQRGFTLLEILIVLVIVAVAAGLLVFGYQDSPQQRLRRQAGDLVALLNAAADEAVMRGVELGLVIDDSGYRFVVFDPKTRRWQPAAARGFAVHTFPERYAIDFSLDGSEVNQRTIERIKLLEQRSEDARLRPSILLLSSGEVTPFKLTLRLANEADGAAVTLRCDGLNPVVLEPRAGAAGQATGQG